MMIKILLTFATALILVYTVMLFVCRTIYLKDGRKEKYDFLTFYSESINYSSILKPMTKAQSIDPYSGDPTIMKARNIYRNLLWLMMVLIAMALMWRGN